MLKIAIISANTPSNPNTGMLTVDFAAASLQSQLPDVEFTWFTFPTPPEAPQSQFTEIVKSTIQFKELPDCLEEIYEHDLIFYWGDFLNSRTWLSQGGPSQIQHRGYSPEETWDIMARCMLLRDAPDSVIRKTILFGGTILPDKQSALEDEAYSKAFIRLASNCHRAWMREPISAARVAMLRKNQQSCLGVDPALLLSPSAEFPAGAWSEGTTRRIGFFVGSRSPVTKDILPFAEELAQRFDAELDWLPWLGQRRTKQRSISDHIKGNLRLLLPLSTRRAQELSIRSSRKSLQMRDNLRAKTLRPPGKRIFGDLLRQLSRYEFVITDTYHLCVNAWRLGVPAICLGSEQPSVKFIKGGTLTDLKKYVFYLTYQATDLYFTLDQLKDPKSASRAASVIDSAQPQAIANRIKAHAQEVKSELIATIREML